MPHLCGTIMKKENINFQDGLRFNFLYGQKNEESLNIQALTNLSTLLLPFPIPLQIVPRTQVGSQYPSFVCFVTK